MEPNSPLSPSAQLAQVPEVDACFAHIAASTNEEQYREAEGALVAAIRDATLSAERQRLLGMTPEEVVETAWLAFSNRWLKASSDDVDELHDTFIAALPLLLAPAQARVEAAEAENEVLASAVRQCAEDTKGYLALIEEMAAVVEAVRKVCPSDEVTGVKEEYAYVCHDEDGEPIVEANTLADAVAQIIGCWESVAERLTTAESRVAQLTKAGMRLANELTCNCGGKPGCAFHDFARALQGGSDQ